MRATAIYSSAQYIGLGLLTPALSYIVAEYGRKISFYLSGGSAFLCVTFFANAFSNLGWLVWSDVISRSFIGTMGGCLNICGNLSGIVSPIVIGVMLQRTNIQYAMWYIAAVALLGLLPYPFMVGKIEVKFRQNLRLLTRNANIYLRH